MREIQRSTSLTTRYQIYCPRGLTEEFEAYVRKHDLSVAEAGRRAIRLLLKIGEPGHANTELSDIESRIAATLSQHGERHRDLLEEIQQLLQQLLIRN